MAFRSEQGTRPSGEMLYSTLQETLRMLVHVLEVRIGFVEVATFRFSSVLLTNLLTATSNVFMYSAKRRLFTAKLFDASSCMMSAVCCLLNNGRKYEVEYVATIDVSSPSPKRQMTLFFENSLSSSRSARLRDAMFLPMMDTSQKKGGGGADGGMTGGVGEGGGGEGGRGDGGGFGEGGGAGDGGGEGGRPGDGGGGDKGEGGCAGGEYGTVSNPTRTPMILSKEIMMDTLL